jgi:hypothetical protein
VTDAEHAAALAEIERLWDAADGTPEAARLRALGEAVADHEDATMPMTDDAPTPLLVTYSPTCGAAYVYFRPIAKGGVYRTDATLFPTLLDFDAAGNLLGVEALDARLLPAEWLVAAVPPGDEGNALRRLRERFG